MKAVSMTSFTINSNHIQLNLLTMNVLCLFGTAHAQYFPDLHKGTQSQHNSDCLCPAFITSISTVALVTGFGLLGRRGWCRRFSG
jgi:hypothetical protein